MTGLENILTQIKTEAEQKASELTAKAEQDAKEILAQAENEVKKLNSDYELRAQKAADDITERMASADDLEGKKRILQKKQQLIADALHIAKTDLGNSDKNKYFEFLESLLNIYAQNTDGEIVLSESDKKDMTNEFKAALEKYNLSLAENASDVEKGFILVYGSVEVNCTLDALFDAYGEELSDMLSITLFGGGK